LFQWIENALQTTSTLLDEEGGECAPTNFGGMTPLLKVTVSRAFERAYTSLGQVTFETDNDQPSSDRIRGNGVREIAVKGLGLTGP